MYLCILMTLFCQYQNIFGKSGEGLHKYRIFGLAAVDLILTIVAAFVISWYFKQPFLKVFLILFVIGVISHLLFCVKTPITNVLTNCLDGLCQK